MRKQLNERHEKLRSVEEALTLREKATPLQQKNAGQAGHRTRGRQGILVLPKREHLRFATRLRHRVIFAREAGGALLDLVEEAAHPSSSRSVSSRRRLACGATSTPASD